MQTPTLKMKNRPQHQIGQLETPTLLSSCGSVFKALSDSPVAPGGNSTRIGAALPVAF